MEKGGMKRGEEFGCEFVEFLGAAEPDVCRYLNLGEEGERCDGEVEEVFLMRYPPPAPFFPTSRTRMLCFGGDEAGSKNGFSRKKKQNTGGSETASSTSSSSSNTSLSKPKLEKKAAYRGSRSANTDACDPEKGSTAAKKARKEKQKTTSQGGATKVRKEKIGDRIIALQQLVSPFGKSDTASVLHEALGYIKFLHDQVQVLSSPYLQQLPSSSDHLQGGGVGLRPRGDLRSRGLCLVPISCMPHVAGSNGPDLWSPAIGSSDHCNGNHAVPKH